PMLLDERIDAFTAMGVSVVMVWNNMGPSMVWGAILLALFLASLLTGLVGLIFVFPCPFLATSLPCRHAMWRGRAKEKR
ncbi:hypothetical protein ACC785_38710, partial [Rhizobium ruizarguesonis]